MRNGLLLGGLATALAVAALVISVIALVSPPDALDELDDYEFHLSDRGEFTVELVRQALRRYDEEGSEATVSYYNSPESAAGELYVFIYDENDQAIAHPDQNLLGQDLKGDLGVWTVLSLIPFANLYADYKQGEAVEALTDGSINRWIIFILWLVFSPAVWFITQTELNKRASEPA